MNKVFVVSVVAAACVFAVNAGAKEGKSGFYLTGKAGASVMSLSDQRFLSGDEEETSKWICPYISRHLLSLNPSLAHCRRYSRGER